jgi:hypothetical protein
MAATTIFHVWYMWLLRFCTSIGKDGHYSGAEVNYLSFIARIAWPTSLPSTWPVKWHASLTITWTVTWPTSLPSHDPSHDLSHDQSHDLPSCPSHVHYYLINDAWYRKQASIGSCYIAQLVLAQLLWPSQNHFVACVNVLIQVHCAVY